MSEQKKPFRTILDPPMVIETNPGSEYEEILALRINDQGEEEFYVKGKTNIYEKIQMYKDDCELEKILERCTETGDFSLINQRQPLYVDLEDMPENIFEAHQKIKEAEQNFMKLPINIRNAYDNNFNKYLADFGSENWLKIMGSIITTEKEEVKTEEKGEETE